jgi:hypothetical protein
MRYVLVTSFSHIRHTNGSGGDRCGTTLSANRPVSDGTTPAEGEGSVNQFGNIAKMDSLIIRSMTKSRPLEGRLTAREDNKDQQHLRPDPRPVQRVFPNQRLSAREVWAGFTAEADAIADADADAEELAPELEPDAGNDPDLGLGSYSYGFGMVDAGRAEVDEADLGDDVTGAGAGAGGGARTETQVMFFGL